MDWTPFTPIYVRTAGDDANDGLTLATAVASGARAVAIAVATPATPYVIDLGVGSFGGITVPVYYTDGYNEYGDGLGTELALPLFFRGAGRTVSFLGGIAKGSQDATVTSDMTCNLGGIYTPTDYQQRSITLADCVTGDVDVSGAPAPLEGYFSTPAGNVTAVRCALGNVSANGGDGDPSLSTGGGGVNLTDCTYGTINAVGGTGQGGGSVTLVRCHGGNVAVDAPNSDTFSFNSGNAGTVTLINCVAGFISAASADGAFATGTGGAVDSHSSVIAGASVTAGYPWAADWMDMSVFGAGGTITLTGGKSTGGLYCMSSIRPTWGSILLKNASCAGSDTNATVVAPDLLCTGLLT